MQEAGTLLITLYLPDELARAMTRRHSFHGVLRNGAMGLDFLLPGWWETCHTARIGALDPAEIEGSPSAASDLEEPYAG